MGVRPFPGVVATLERLNRQGIALVAWADSPEPAARVATRIERLGLGSCFRAILSSFDVEAAQPEPVCYQSALDALGHAAADTVYVGHDAAHLAGAKAMGLRTVAFNFQPPAVADGYLTRFEDLLMLIEGDTARNVQSPSARTSTLRSRVALPAAPGHQR